MAYRIRAPEQAAPQRVDRFLAEQCAPLTRSRIKTLIKAGHATRDGAPLREPAEIVRAGALYVLAPPDPVDAVPQPQAIPFPILFEDQYLLVIDKPAGLVVHPAPGHEDGTLVNALLAHCGDSLPGIGGERRPGIVHRLDQDTSGVMVVAKTEQALAALSALFAARDLDRAYLALAWGVPPTANLAIDAPIGRDPRDRKRMAINPKGRHALTRIRLRTAYHNAVSLLECRLATGRTHQIRVHLAANALPVVGDPLYLRRIPAIAKSLPASLRSPLLDFPRQALHAASLGFRHPVTGQYYRYVTPPPTDFQDLLALLDPSVTPDWRIEP